MIYLAYARTRTHGEFNNIFDFDKETIEREIYKEKEIKK